jgi:hypothetical protein
MCLMLPAQNTIQNSTVKYRIYRNLNASRNRSISWTENTEHLLSCKPYAEDNIHNWLQHYIKVRYTLFLFLKYLLASHLTLFRLSPFISLGSCNHCNLTCFLWFIHYDRGSQSVRRGALGRREE